MFFKTKFCRNKLYIYPEVEVHVAKQNAIEFIDRVGLSCTPNTEISYKKKHRLLMNRGTAEQKPI